MNVTINIDETGTLNFDMTHEQVSNMITAAFGCDQSAALMNSQSVPTETKPFVFKKESVPPTQSKVNRMFGDNWRSTNVANHSQQNYNFEGYKGFLIVKCPQCGKIKSFCSKKPIKSSFCSCGNDVELKDLRKVVLDCKCGKSWRYMTNIKSDKFTHNCLDCGSPIDVEFNTRRGYYETMR